MTLLILTDNDSERSKDTTISYDLLPRDTPLLLQVLARAAPASGPSQAARVGQHSAVRGVCGRID